MKTRGFTLIFQQKHMVLPLTQPGGTSHNSRVRDDLWDLCRDIMWFHNIWGVFLYRLLQQVSLWSYFCAFWRKSKASILKYCFVLFQSIEQLSTNGYSRELSEKACIKHFLASEFLKNLHHFPLHASISKNIRFWDPSEMTLTAAEKNYMKNLTCWTTYSNYLPLQIHCEDRESNVYSVHASLNNSWVGISNGNTLKSRTSLCGGCYVVLSLWRVSLVNI